MSANGEVPAAAQQVPGPVPLSPEAIDHALYVVGSHPLRVLALSAFVQASEQGLRPSEAHGQIQSARVEAGEQVASRTGRPTFVDYCRGGLRFGGYLQLAEHEEGRDARLQITELGKLALAPAGMAALYERRHPELSLPELFGNVRHSSDGGLYPGPALRLGILTRLVEQPEGLPALQLTTADAAAKSTLRLLKQVGILRERDKHDAQERLFVVTPPTRRHIIRATGSDVRPESIALHIAAARLASRTGRFKVGGADLVAAAMAVDASLDPMEIWSVLMNNQPTYIRTVDTKEFGGKGYSSNYTIAPELRGAAEDLVNSLREIKEDRNAWDAAADYGRHLLADAKEVSYLVRKGFRKSRITAADDNSSPAQVILQSIPEAGIDEIDLLHAVTSRRKMSWLTMHTHIARLPGVLIEQRPRGPGRGRRANGWVTNWGRTFSPNWRTRGHCADNPEIFFPIGATGLSATQTARAKQVCQGCPVRPACLKTAMDTGEGGIWGGFTEDERRHLPANVQQALGQVTVRY